MNKSKILKKETVLLSFLFVGLAACENMQTPFSKGNKNTATSANATGDYIGAEDNSELRGSATEVDKGPSEIGDGVLPDSLESDYDNPLPNI